MPIYEYRCASCGHELEAFQKMSDAPLTDCPACEKPALSKLISAVGFRLKGGGWYETDFKTGEKKKNLAEGARDNKSSEKSDTKTDKSGKSKESKPNEKTKTKKAGSEAA